MDDANVPVGSIHHRSNQTSKSDHLLVFQSLLSLPYLGFLPKNDSTYLATRKLLLSNRNPYFAAGKTMRGIG